MTAPLLAAPITAPSRLAVTLAGQGHAVLAPAGLCEWVPATPAELGGLRASWDDLPADAYLRDGGRYRRRRHASYVIDAGEVRAAPQRAHWQPLEYNALHGGLERWFEPIRPDVAQRPVWPRLLGAFARLCSELNGEQPWFVEAHQFRIDTTDGLSLIHI